MRGSVEELGEGCDLEPETLCCTMPRFLAASVRLDEERSDGSTLSLLRKDPDDGAQRQPRAQRHQPQVAPEPSVGSRADRARHDAESPGVFAMPEIRESDQAGRASEGNESDFAGLMA